MPKIFHKKDIQDLKMLKIYKLRMGIKLFTVLQGFQGFFQYDISIFKVFKVRQLEFKVFKVFKVQQTP